MIENSIARGICLLIANYLLLSTLLIAFIASVCKFGRIKSFALRDQLWKFAIVVPFLLIGIQSIVQPPGTTWNVATFFEETTETTLYRTLEPVTFRKPSTQDVVNETPSVMAEEVSLDENPQLPLIPHEPDTEAAVVVVEELDDSDTFADQGIVFSFSETDSVQPPSEIIQGEVEATADQRPSTVGIVTSKLPETKSFSLLTPLFVVCCFALTVAFGALKSLILSCRVWFTLRRYQVIDSGPLWNMSLRLQQQLNCKHNITILERPGHHEPAACGIWNRKILIPENLMKRLPAAEVEALIAHELAHLQRSDPFWGWMFQLVKSCFFWQPLNFLAVKQWRVVAEHCCDSQAVNSGIDRLTLARCLTSIAAWKLTPQPAIGIGVSTSTLGHRVEVLVDSSAHQDIWNKGWRRRLRWLFGASMIAATVLFVPRMSWTSESVEEVPVGSIETGTASTFDDSASIPVDPLPLTTPPMAQQSFSEVIPVQPTRLDNLNENSLVSEIEQVARDLSYALTLLGEQEQDPEILAAISSLQKRIAQLKERSAKLNNPAELSTTELVRDQKDPAHESPTQPNGGTR